MPVPEDDDENEDDVTITIRLSGGRFPVAGAVPTVDKTDADYALA